jgi:propanol-preferring alcohol dehydrogenase
MILDRIYDFKEQHQPLRLADLPKPFPENDQILIKVTACGVCHTELDEIEGRTPPPSFPMVLGHQVVGLVENAGEQSDRFQPGQRVGVAWIYSACAKCKYCQTGQENLCPDFMATGRDANGGYAEYMVVPQAFAHPIPPTLSDSQAAPHLCAGAIGYRSLRLTNLSDGQTLGLTGFGASAHLVLKLVRSEYPNTQVYVFTRSAPEREFARELGAVWAGEIEASAPQPLDCIIDTTPAWKPDVEALRNLAPGGRLVINAIRKEAGDQDYLLKLNYPTHLWMEKEIKSVANVTRLDVIEFLELAGRIPIIPEVQEYALEQANQALYELKTRKIRGAKVLKIT